MSYPLGLSSDNSYLKKLDEIDERLKRVLEIQAKLVSAIITEVSTDENKSAFPAIQKEITDLLGECPKSSNQLFKELGNNNNRPPVTFPHPKLEDKH
ncbi:hypothetical protein CDG77_10185 [Nostoc sp. 'Peltigera membranacea cyanobiont' 213]|uniref:hypothetical protein n=1 Tax=Nostoc sp. 'Peltigera membranacea cyanobiont' 213 TaxID=2014530 RepID=UPI000B957717|nr:hypothetical protein [Nostoc sp. 'Peltigera membranacea cyanobiont' 213]OYD95914.1 hypothetical protein CDG77_10185 [Nostoc sp. 'Peltigera membranacea cyanobiont' 213]